jgi:hypothetical protein
MRVPGGTRAQPFFFATICRYALLVAQVRNLNAASLFLLEASIASDHTQSQCDPSGVTLVGAYAKPMSLATLDFDGSVSRPAATVASTHIAVLPWPIAVAHSVKPLLVAPGSP